MMMRGGCKDILYTHETHCILFIGFILVIISGPQDIYIHNCSPAASLDTDIRQPKCTRRW